MLWAGGALAGPYAVRPARMVTNRHGRRVVPSRRQVRPPRSVVGTLVRRIRPSGARCTAGVAAAADASTAGQRAFVGVDVASAGADVRTVDALDGPFSFGGSGHGGRVRAGVGRHVDLARRIAVVRCLARLAHARRVPDAAPGMPRTGHRLGRVLRQARTPRTSVPVMSGHHATAHRRPDGEKTSRHATAHPHPAAEKWTVPTGWRVRRRSWRRPGARCPACRAPRC